MSILDTIAAALHAACLRDLPSIERLQVNGGDERRYLDTLSREDRREYFNAKSSARENLEFYAERGILLDRVITRPTPKNCTVTVFHQTWGSTALGYGGIGCQAMTRAATTLVKCDHTQCVAVYFGGNRLAYLIPAEHQNEHFTQSMRDQTFPSVAHAKTLGWIPEADSPVGSTRLKHRMALAQQAMRCLNETEGQISQVHRALAATGSLSANNSTQDSPVETTTPAGHEVMPVAKTA